MPALPFTPVHRIEFWRESGSRSDPDNPVTETMIGTAYADRKDMRAMETGKQGQQYFKTQVVYTVPARVVATLMPTGDQGMTSPLGEDPLGSDPMGLPDSPPKVGIGSNPEPDWLIYDRGRRARYRIVGRTQSEDLRFWKLFTEELR